MPSAMDKYREMSLELFPTGEIEKLRNEAANTGNDIFLKWASQVLFPLDLKIVCTMLDEGYPLKETTESLNQYSLFAVAAKERCTSEDMRHHADHVMAHVNEVRERKVGEKYELAKKFYLSRSNHKTFDEAQEGGIILSMLAGGFSADVVEAVILDNNAVMKESPALLRRMIEDCVEIRHFYDTLRQAVSPAAIHRGSLSAYRYFASEYLRKSKQSVLSIQGDQAIAHQMIEAGFKEDFIIKSLRHSPIASEPWRDKSRYIKTILSKVQEVKAQQNYANNRYMLTASMYDDKINRFLAAVEQKAQAYDIVSSRAYCDGIVARELLEEHQLRTNVERVIAKKSPEAKKAQAGEMNESARSYGMAIVAAAYAVLRAESVLLKEPKMPIPEDVPLQELKERGVTVGDLYQDAIHRRICHYPSTAAMLTAPFVDRDVVENLLTRYPGIDRKDVEEAIRENSPRAQMSGVGEDYPATVIESVYTRLNRLAEQKKRQSEFTKEMKEHTRLEKDAFTAGSSTWNLTLCTGLVAIRMLQEGHSDREILPALIQPPDITEQDASHIMSSAENVLSRMEYIRQYIPFSDLPREHLEPKALSGDEYIRLYQAASMSKDRLMTDLDVEIATNMLLKGYTRDEVQETVQTHSPVAAEPGRNSDYSFYITEQAELAIEKEKERLKVYRPMPRNEREYDAEKEYAYHVGNMRTSFFLPHESFMDRLIAEAMLVQGFQEAEIGAAIEKLSPVANGGEGYGMGILHSLAANTAELVTEEPVRVRSMKGH